MPWIINFRTPTVGFFAVKKKGQQILEISACPESNDVIGLQDLYLQLDRSSVEMIVDEISSGLDPSGSNYTVSPSYNPERIVRN